MRIFLFLLSLNSFLTVHAQPANVLRIDPDYATGRPASQVFDHVKFIPLETTRKSLFGTVNQLEITDSIFIIRDNSTNCILFFDRKGKFKSKINGRGRRILSFKLNHNRNQIEVYQTNVEDVDQIIKAKAETDLNKAIALLNRLIKVSHYDLAGRKIKSSPKKSLTPSYLASIELPNHISISNFALAGSRMPDSQAYELNFFEDQHLYKQALPYNTAKDIARYGRYLDNPSGFSRSTTDSIIYFTRPFDYTVYRVTPHTIKEKYKIVFPVKNTFPESFFTDDLSQNDRMAFFRDNPSMITGISKIHLREDRLFFKISNNERNWNASNSFMYNIKTGDLVSVNRVSPDSSTYFLPVFDYSFGNESFKNIEADYLYTYVSSRRMFQAFESNEKREVTYPAEMQRYFETSRQKDNPVLVQLKPKENS